MKGSDRVARDQSFTCLEASLRYQGVTPELFSRMCNRGKLLLAIYGAKEKIPAKEKDRAIFAKKVGKKWFIPSGELRRLFTP